MKLTVKSFATFSMFSATFLCSSCADFMILLISMPRKKTTIVKETIVKEYVPEYGLRFFHRM